MISNLSLARPHRLPLRIEFMSKPVPPAEKATGATGVERAKQAFKLALSLTLFYWLALWMNWPEAQYGGLAIVIISLGTTGATIEKGIMRVFGTTVGVAVGLLILALFNHDRWAVLVAFIGYLTLIGYFMQVSRYNYAWYAAGFVPLVVWADTYPHFESAFYYATFRYLETMAGVIIYTLVDLVFWPRSAGDKLHRDGRTSLKVMENLFKHDCQRLENQELAAGTDGLRPQVSHALVQTFATLQQAYLDSQEVRTRKQEWEKWRSELKATADALDKWQQTIDACSGFDLPRLVPQLDTQLEAIGVRFSRIQSLWEETHTKVSDRSEPDKDRYDEVRTVKLDPSTAAEFGSKDREVLTNFLHQLQDLDRASLNLLDTQRVLAGHKPIRELPDSIAIQEEHATPLWDAVRFERALYPPVAFIVGFLFWIFMNPPGATGVPLYCGIISLAVLRTPMNPIAGLALMLLSALFVVAPVYWFVMPMFTSGFELLGLIFAYAFTFGYLGERSAALKSGPMLIFVSVTGISNQQSYSFQEIVVGTLLILLAGTIATSVYYLFKSSRLNVSPL
ncbi:FUSC family protein [Rosistilla oblonga]|uniref:FUSC family protein n=1 Tax=Rosistilla oblonga TaxID=2527990 RepID=UPI003A97DC08